MLSLSLTPTPISKTEKNIYLSRCRQKMIKKHVHITNNIVITPGRINTEATHHASTKVRIPTRSPFLP